MPYDPGISYRGDQYIYQGGQALAQGIAGIGQAFQDWQKKHDETARNLGESDAIVQYALKTGAMSPQQWTEYIGANESKKAGIAAGIAKNETLFNAQQQQAQEQAYRYAALKQHVVLQQQSQEFQRQMQKAQQAFQEKQAAAVSPMMGQPYYHPTSGAPIGAYDETGNLKFFPEGAAAAAPQDMTPQPFIDPITKQAVPGKAYIPKTGAIASTLSPEQESGVQLDPSGKPFYWDTKSQGWKEINAKAWRQMQMGKGGEEELFKTKPTLLESIKNRIFGGGTTPAPTPAAAAPTLNYTPKQVTSQAEYNALPSGTRYIAPDGSLRIKP